MTLARPDVSAPPTWIKDWKSIDWKIVYRKVWQLQMRIAKAVRERRWGKVKVLQRNLSRSLYGRLWAVRRVTTNKGKRTPGIDGVIWSTPRKKMQAVLSLRRRDYRPLPLRRIYIPKKVGRRPLGIPTMKDRAMQALYLLGLNPVAETLGDRNSYGFRLRRSTADALGQCYILLAKSYSPEWIWEADIESCFDNISHEWMLKNIPLDKSILARWLKAGYLEGSVLFPTERGTPQGGLISPVLANITLDGLEEVARKSAPKRIERNSIRSKIHLVRYCDDFIVTAHSRELLEEKVIPAVVSFLKERGLNISKMKSRITQIRTGFDFLGANLRKYGRGKFLMKPARSNVLGFSRELRDYIRSRRGLKTEYLVHQLNRRIRGWANYYRPLVSGKAFRDVDSRIFECLWRWARRRHSRKRAKWVFQRYFLIHPNGSWVFFAPTRDRDGRPSRLKLVKASVLGIRRHIKIRADATVFDPSYTEYFRERELRKRQARQRDYRRWQRWLAEKLEYA